MRAALTEIAPTNDQGELYLTDVLAVVRQAGEPVGALLIDDRWQTEGINDRVQLSRMNTEVNRRILQHWMREGVTVVDPATTWVHASVDLAPDVTLLPGTSLEGATSVAAGAQIGPDTTLIDVEVGENAAVTRTQGSLSVIGAGANVGPFAYLRPGTTLGAGGKIGTFVETKNAQIGAGAKAPHLSYLGDAVIGEGANIGAGRDLRQLRRGHQVDNAPLGRTASSAATRYWPRRSRSPTARTLPLARRSPATSAPVSLP